jgi:aerobic carbon-monoxide dehydrogenase small subunit
MGCRIKPGNDDLRDVVKPTKGALAALDRTRHLEQGFANLAAGDPPRPSATRTPPMGGVSMPKLSMTVNGKPVTGEVESRTLLVDFLRVNLGLTGTHVGCDTSQCGACVVEADGKAIKSCTALAVACQGSQVTTIEGIATNGQLHPMQEAFRTHHGLQCGFCTPGMIMSALDIVRRKGKDLDEATVRNELEGNMCRCTGYHNIVKAIQAGAAGM